MDADDPRHGTYAGVLVHYRADGKLCDACRTAHRRSTKRAKMRLDKGIYNRVPLGDRAWHILTDSGCTKVAKLTGLGRNNLYRMQRSGPDTAVLRSTRARILACAPPTVVGLQRRLQALAVMGYSAPDIAAIAGCHPEPLLRIRRGRRSLVKSHVADGICRAYDLLHMTPATTRMAATVQQRATGKGYAAPFGWDCIDTDAEPYRAPKSWHPQRHTWKREDLLEEWGHLTSLGVAPEQAARQLGVTIEAVERADARARGAA